MKEVRKDLWTKTEYSKRIGVSSARVGQMVREGKLKVVLINGGELIKTS